VIGFVSNADVTVGGLTLVSKSIDHGGGDDAVTVATLVIDTALLMLFGVQDSLMACPAFKRWWTRIVPSSAERSTYVVATNVCLIVLVVAWPFLYGMVSHPIYTGFIIAFGPHAQ
jgi:protein-S-isoprenylcysteine O-methyltransferase Ste14